MENIFPISGIQINYLSPLKRWRLLDLRNLWSLSCYESTYKSFSKMVLRLEKKGVVESVYEPFTRRKFVYLTKRGNSFLAGGDNPPSISKETFVHDAKVVDIVLSAMRLNCFYGFELEHELAEKNKFKVNYKLCPDAILLGEKENIKFRLAFELELTRKSKSKYITKIGQYLESSFYDYVFYFFLNEGVMNSYLKSVAVEFGEKVNDKIIFGVNSNLLGRDFDLSQTKLVFKGKEVHFDELFN